MTIMIIAFLIIYGLLLCAFLLLTVLGSLYLLLRAVCAMQQSKRDSWVDE